MQPHSINYHTYMLRIWSEPKTGRIAGQSQWRFSLNDTASGQQWGFVSIEGLANFLKELFPTENKFAINAESTLML